MLNNFAEKKRNLFSLRSLKNRTFAEGLTHAFGQIMPIFSLFKFDQNKPRNNAF